MSAASERNAAYDAWLAELTATKLEARFRELGVEKVVMKRLSPNQDNSQNQFYWQGDLNENPLPLGDWVPFESKSKKKGPQTGYKASLNLEWLTPAGINPAPLAQVIYYPQYPETRLGSLLDRAPYAPRSVIGSRGVGPGRLLLLGIAEANVIGVALPPTSPAAASLMAKFGASPFATWALTPQAKPITAEEMLAELAGVHHLNPVLGCKVVRDLVVSSGDPNAPGTTLETVMGVRPNGRDEPDFHGWELKTHADSRVTLMTPAPTGGAIKALEPEEFMRAFGRLNDAGTRWDFNGAHRANHAPGGLATTVLNVTPDEVQLVHKDTGDVAMTWRTSDLLTHWTRKHSRAAYIRRSGKAATGFAYGPYVQLGEGINWKWFRQALDNGTIALDPAYNMIKGARSMRKARAQFRCYSYELGALYPSVTVHDLRHTKPTRRLSHTNLRAEGLVLPDWLEA